MVTDHTGSKEKWNIFAQLVYFFGDNKTTKLSVIKPCTCTIMFSVKYVLSLNQNFCCLLQCMKLGLRDKNTESNQLEHRFSPRAIDQFYLQHTPVNKFMIKQQNFDDNKFLSDIENQYRKLPIMSSGLVQLHKGFYIRRAYK